ncbi:MAG: hypothetical protein ACK56Q_06590 [Pirellulaceae bacterium]
MTEPTSRDWAEIPRVQMDWYRSMPPWRLMSRAITIAWRSSHLVFALLGIGATIFGSWFASILFETSSVVATQPSWTPKGGSLIEAIRQGGLSEGALASARLLREPWDWFVATTLSAAGAVGWNGLAQRVFTVGWTMIVWSLIGGLLLRRSLVELGTQSTIGWSDCFRTVGNRLASLLWSILLPWSMVLAIALPIMVICGVARLGSVGNWIATVLLGLMLILLLQAGWAMLHGVLGFPLAMAGVLAERKGDAFEGYSRSSAYLFQKPFTLGIALLVGTVAGVVGALMTAVAGWLASRLMSTLLIQLGPAGEPGMPLSILTRWIDAWPYWVGLAFAFSFFWTSAAALYLILRKEIDSTEYEEIDLDLPLQESLVERSEIEEVEKKSGEAAKESGRPAGE